MEWNMTQEKGAWQIKHWIWGVPLFSDKIIWIQKCWIMVVSCTWESKNQRVSDLERRGVYTIIYIYICVCVCIYICIYIYVYIYTYIHYKHSLDLDKSAELCGLKIVIHPQKQGHETSITSKHWHVSQHATTWTIWITNMLILTVKSLTFQ